MRKLMLLLGVFFLIVACSTNSLRKDERYAGQVEGQLIERPLFTTNFLYNYNDYTKGDKSFKPTDQDIKIIEEATWDAIVKNVVISQFLKKHNISVTPEEVIDSLLNNPPQFLQDSGYFNTKGKFDYNKYKSSILSNDPVATDGFKYNYFQTLTIRKINEKLKEVNKISQNDLKKFYHQKYALANIMLLKMRLDTVQPEVTETEIENIWKNDKKEYFYEPALDINYLIQEIEPSKDEIERTKDTIDSLYFALSKGGDFDVAVREFSSNLQAYPLGKMPFISFDNVPNIIRSQVAKGEIGEVISPVNKNNVWYIYKIIDKTKSMVKLQEIKHPVQISQKTILQRREDFLRVKDLIEQIGIKKAGYEYDWQVYSAKNLNQQKTYVENLGDLSDLINDAKNKADGYIYSPIYNKNERFLVMVQIDSNRLNKKKELELVKDEIRDKIIKVRRFEYISSELKKHAQDYRQIMNSSDQFLTYDLLVNIGIDDELADNLGLDINKELISLNEPGEYTNCYTNDTEGYLAVLLKKIPANDGAFERNYEKIEMEYRQEKFSNYYDEWINKAIKKAKVKKWFKMEDLSRGYN